MLRPPLPSLSLVSSFLRRLRTGGLWLFVLLVAAAVLPSSQTGASSSGAGELLLDLGVNGQPSPDEWARLRSEMWRRGREAAAAAARDRALAAAAASGPGASAPPVMTVPSGSDRSIPAMALRAYRQAAAWASGYDPGCGLRWSVLAGIGKLESNHGLHFGAATRFSPTGVVSPVITGPPLNGAGVARIPDTDGGRWDTDTTWDRAVGPMQFLPSTWRRLGRDGNGDGVADPNNLFDATVSAAAYLCLVGGDLRQDAGLRRAVYGYNHSWPYVDAVLRWAALYDHGFAVGPTVATGTSTTNPPAAAAASTGSSAGKTTTSGKATTTTARSPTSGPTTTKSSTTTTRPPTSSTTSTTAPTTTTECATTTTIPDPTTTVPPCP